MHEITRWAPSFVAVLVTAALAFAAPAQATPVFINEIHYDNTGTDAGEAIEIAGPAGTNLTGWSIVLYNGTGGAPYNTTLLSGAIPDQGGGFGTLALSYPANGIQNGSPDGVALVDATNHVVQFLSYEGSFAAVGGPANGLLSSDIGVSENGSGALGTSLQLGGNGTQYEDFTWNGAAPHTFASINTGQLFTTPPPPTGCGQPATLISQIQGTGDVSPLAGQPHTVQAVVVGAFQGGAALNGFFLEQEAADQDGDARSSEGLFVASNLLAVHAGDVVRVAGIVTEVFGLTELTAVSQLQICGTASVASVPVLLPFDGVTNNAERYENMLVTLPQALTVTENFNLGRFGELMISSGGRLLNPTQMVAPGAAAIALQAQNDRNRLTLNDGSSVENPDPVIYPSPALSAANTLRSGYSASGITGVLYFGFGSYRVEPTQPVAFAAGANPRPAAPVLPGIGALRVASFNVLNFFNGNGQGGGFPTSRGANTPAEFQRQKDKIVAAIRTLNADVVGLMEIENDGYGAFSAIQELVNGLNAVAGSGTYAFINPGVPVIGTDEISVGLLYKPSKVTPVGAAKILNSAVDARFIDTRNRPVLAQSFRDSVSGKTLTLAVNHLKSKGSACDDIGDPDTGDGQGNCNRTRTDAARALVDWLATDPTASHDPDFLIIGDLNSYAKEDPITVIAGAGYLNLIEARLGAGAYSFVFDGQSGYLDHALARATLVPQVTGVAEWHLNADEPHTLDYNVEFKSPGQIASYYSPDPYRSSDHDPVVLEMFVPGDLDNDGDVDSADRDRLRGILGKCSGAAGFNAEADYDRDGCVSNADYRRWYDLFLAYQAKKSQPSA